MFTLEKNNPTKMGTSEKDIREHNLKEMDQNRPGKEGKGKALKP